MSGSGLRPSRPCGSSARSKRSLIVIRYRVTARDGCASASAFAFVIHSANHARSAIFVLAFAHSPPHDRAQFEIGMATEFRRACACPDAVICACILTRDDHRLRTRSFAAGSRDPNGHGPRKIRARRQPLDHASSIWRLHIGTGGLRLRQPRSQAAALLAGRQVSMASRWYVDGIEHGLPVSAIEITVSRISSSSTRKDAHGGGRAISEPVRFPAAGGWCCYESVRIFRLAAVFNAPPALEKGFVHLRVLSTMVRQVPRSARAAALPRWVLCTTVPGSRAAADFAGPDRGAPSTHVTIASYRVTQKKYAATAFDGWSSQRLYGGRWKITRAARSFTTASSTSSLDNVSELQRASPDLPDPAAALLLYRGRVAGRHAARNVLTRRAHGPEPGTATRPSRCPELTARDEDGLRCASPPNWRWRPATAGGVSAARPTMRGRNPERSPVDFGTPTGPRAGTISRPPTARCGRKWCQARRLYNSIFRGFPRLPNFTRTPYIGACPGPPDRPFRIARHPMPNRMTGRAHHRRHRRGRFPGFPPHRPAPQRRPQGYRRR